MMVLIDQDGGDAPFVEVTVRLNASDLARLGEAERRALYSDDTQTVLDQLAPAHRFLSREGSL